jgi:hypothetical protein
MEAYQSDLDALARRVERLEELLNLQGEDAEFEQELAELICGRKGHEYKTVSYDLQGGKWGKQRCTRCGDEHSWSV